MEGERESGKFYVHLYVGNLICVYVYDEVWEGSITDRLEAGGIIRVAPIGPCTSFKF